ncbi:hypothetical protein C8Q77DRAFT_1157588 [Trametes polyzona]|nr:hypothetical protein C8Q77DRAFT_1157588 [Trametes polyzona]
MDSHKRKRDDEGTVVTFYTPNRTFQRVYKGQSLEETKALVRTKLGLSEDASIRFSRLHEGRHIDLEDEDDFEAFRHLARYVTTLDVSVFLGDAGPPIFSQKASAEAAPTQIDKQRRKKKKHSEHRVPIPLEPVSGRSTPTSAASIRAPTSTLDADGIPQKKRKRREEQAQDVSIVTDSAPENVSHHRVTEIPTKVSKKSRKEAKASDAVRNASSATAAKVPDSPAPAIGSKRKRHESPEASAASSSRQTASQLPAQPIQRPPSPAPPAKKKQKKDKRPRVEEAASETDGAPAVLVSKPDKKGKRRAEAIPESDNSNMPMDDVAELRGGEVADTEDNVNVEQVSKKAKEKKEKKKKSSAKDVPLTDVSGASAELPVLSKKKHKRKQVEETERATVGETADSSADASVPEAESSNTAEVRKEKKKKKAKGAEPAALADAAEEPSTPAGNDEATSSEGDRRKRGRKSKAVDLSTEPSADPESIAVPEASAADLASASVDTTEAPQKDKRKKRRKTLAADTSVDPDASTISTATVPDADTTQTEEPQAEDSVPSSSAAKKRNRKKSIAPGQSQQPTNVDSASAMAAVQAAALAVLARNAASIVAPSPPASASATQEAASEPTPDPVLPGRKRKAGKSKLRQTWGPEDISVDDQSSISIAPVVQEPGPSADQPLSEEPVSQQRATGQSTSEQPTSNAASSAPPESISVAPKPPKRKKMRPSSAPSCPICEKAALHSRSECPVVKGGVEAIRKRIAQLREAGHDEELIEELEVLLKEAQRRRKSAGDRHPGGVLAPIQVPSTASEGSTPSPVFPLSAASFAARPAPLPRVPAGSEISEVAVESKDEGSSNESSSSSSEDEGDAEEAAASAKPPSASTAPVNMSMSDLASIDVEALLRGPAKPRVSILQQIPSNSTSEDEGESSEEDVRMVEDVDMEEDEKRDRAFRRLSRKLQRDASSSADEQEPEAEDEKVEPPTFMDVDPNGTVDKTPDVEVEVSASKEDEAGEHSSEAPAEEHAEGIEPEVASKEATDQGYASDAEEAVEAHTSTREENQSGVQDAEVHGDSDSESESEPESKEEAQPSADGGDDSKLEQSPEVDGPIPSQEPVEVPAPTSEPPQTMDDEETGDTQVQAAHDGADQSRNEDSTSEDDREVEQDTALTASAARALSPELGEADTQPSGEPEAEPERTSSPPPLRQPDPVVGDDDVTMPTNISGAASSIDLHPGEDPSDPIESLGSFADVSERHHAVDDDPIEDADAESIVASSQVPGARASAELSRLQESTPPPAVHRTPGTVSRMKDRYGRLTSGSPAKLLPSLSQAMLDAHASSQSQSDGDAEMHAEPDGPQQQEQDDSRADVDMSADASEQALSAQAPSQEPQEEVEEEEPQELETRPRRATRLTRRASAMTRATSVPGPSAPTPTPAAAPPSTAPAAPAAAAPKRRGGRLTAEEKAAREAEKKAERERKAAEKLAEREAKAAAKKAEKEAKEAAKRAEKEAKEAAKRAEKEAKEAEEPPKRARGRAARGRGATTTKPVSTRRRAAASAETEPVEDAEGQENEASGEPSGLATPGFSKVSWTTLPSTQPLTQTESVPDMESSMVDELQPSSPERSISRVSHSPEPVSRTTNTTEKDEADVSREVTITQDRPGDEQEEEVDITAATPRPTGRSKDPLFIPSSSQFPNTPFPDDGLSESTPRVNGHAHSIESDSDADGEDQDAGDDDDEEAGLQRPKTRPRSWQAAAPYRRLSDLMSQQLFPASQIPSPALFPASQSQPRKASSGYGYRDEDDDDDDDDDESDEGSSSGSDAEVKKSHIPRERRAGAGVQKKKGSLLSKFAA